jgi:hypothetical protein
LVAVVVPVYVLVEEAVPVHVLDFGAVPEEYDVFVTVVIVVAVAG